VMIPYGSEDKSKYFPSSGKNAQSELQFPDLESDAMLLAYALRPLLGSMRYTCNRSPSTSAIICV